MPLVSQIATAAFAATILATAVPGWAAADPDDAALGLKSASERPDEATRKPLKFFVEGAIGNASLRYEPGSRSLRRVSFDMFYSGRVATDWRFVLSDRLDHALPNSGGSDDTLNSLREAYLSWEGDGGNTVVDIGRINLRYGPAYGYNPTDFFRDGALRSITSVNPFARP